MYKPTLLLALAIALASCSSPRIDTTTDETMKTSIANVRESLPVEDRAKLDDALQLVAFSAFDANAILSGAMDTAAIAKGMRDRLSGKSAAELLTMADSIRAEQKRKAREAAMAEIRALQAKRIAAQTEAAKAKRFEIVSARFRMGRDYFGLPEPGITMTVRNGTDHAVSRAYFVGTLQSAGRAVPWVKEEFNYSIRGGIEPGETQTWRLAPNSYSAWGTARAPADAVLTVEVVRLDGANEEPLADGMGFSQQDSVRLAELVREYGQ